MQMSCHQAALGAAASRPVSKPHPTSPPTHAMQQMASTGCLLLTLRVALGNSSSNSSTTLALAVVVVVVWRREEQQQQLQQCRGVGRQGPLHLVLVVLAVCHHPSRL